MVNCNKYSAFQCNMAMMKKFNMFTSPVRFLSDFPFGAVYVLSCQTLPQDDIHLCDYRGVVGPNGLWHLIFIP